MRKAVYSKRRPIFTPYLELSWAPNAAMAHETNASGRNVCTIVFL